MSLVPGSTLGPYTITAELGHGGMGVVYTAHDPRLKRQVAIKLLTADLTRDETAKQRFLQEAQAASALDHPNICTIFEINETDDGQLYLVMAYYEGETLRERIERGPLALDDAIDIATQVGQGLAEAHGAGIVHRDIKPANLLIAKGGVVKILDFGLAKLAGAEEVTQTRTALGTVAYMSPEQARGEEVDHRTDIWSLGVVLYETLSGQQPFQGENLLVISNGILKDQPSPLPALSSSVQRVVSRSLNKSRGQRYQAVTDLLDNLKSATAPEARTTSQPAVLETGGEALPELPSFLNASASKADSPTSFVVGRGRELHVMSEALDAATSDGVRPLFVVGEAGSGKTTLIHEFVRRAQEAHPALVVASGNCDAQTGIGDPYLPFRDVLALLCGEVESRCAAGSISLHQARLLWELFPETLDALLSTGRDLIDTFVSADLLLSRSVHFPSSRSSRVRLERLATATPPAVLKQSAVLDQYTRLLLELARERPLLVVVEDLHWADAGTVSLLFHLCRRLEGSPVLVVGSYRPALLNVGGEPHPLQSAVHELRAHFGDVDVLLGSEGGRAFVDAVIDASPNRLGRDFRDALFRQTLGHPLFTVELLRELRERDVVSQDAEGRDVVSGAIDWQALPARVEAVIAERLERLPDTLKRFLKLGSIEGEEFTAEVIARAVGADERDVVRALSEELDKRHQLVGALGVRRSGSQRLSHYRFRHILFQKYLYQQIDAVERSYLHEEVGVHLESLLGDKASEAAAQLARHFEEAGLADKAIGYLQQAGERAVRLAANEHAVDHFSRALKLLDHVPDALERKTRELELQLGLAAALQATRGLGFSECERAYARAKDLILEVGATGRLFPAQWGLWGYHVLRGNFEISTPLAVRLLAVAESESDDALLVQAVHAEVTDAFARGDLPAASGASERERALYRKEAHYATTFQYGNHDPMVCCLSFGAMTAALMGEPGRALELAEEAVALGQSLDHSLSSLQAHALRAAMYQVNGDATGALESAETAMRRGFGPDGPQFWGFVHAARGWALGRLGRHKEGLDALRQALAEYERAGTHVWTLYALALLAETLLTTGASDEAAPVLEQAAALLERLGSHFYQAEVLRLQGEALLVASGRAEAERYFTRALDAARAQRARALELRAAMSLAQSQKLDGRESEAREPLGRAIGGFPKDGNHYLEEASTLLQKL